MTKLVWSSPPCLFEPPKWISSLWLLFFTLYLYLVKVGKNYENSVNHGGDTSHQSHDKIPRHTHATLRLFPKDSLSYIMPYYEQFQPK